MREGAAKTIPRILSLLVADMKAKSKLTDEEKKEIDVAHKRAQQLLTVARMQEESVDTNNVIFRMLAAVPFPEQLAGPGALTDSFPLIAAVGALFHLIAAERGIMAGAASALNKWSSIWVLRFASARIKLLPPEYYFEPVPAEPTEPSVQLLDEAGDADQASIGTWSEDTDADTDADETVDAGGEGADAVEATDDGREVDAGDTGENDDNVDNDDE
jgi:hypothetical protein